MAKVFTPAFTQQLEQEVSTLCTCWLISLKDGRKFGFTNLDREVTIEGLIYHPEGGFVAEANKSTSDVSSAKQGLKSILNSDLINAGDLLAGEYDGALVQIFLINWLSPPTSLTAMPLQYRPGVIGVLGEVVTDGESFTAQFVGRLDRFNSNLSEVTSKTCRNELGDSKCGVPLAGYTVGCQVIWIVDRRTFVVDAVAPAIADYFGEGELTFYQGKNHSNSYQINSYTESRQITLYEPVRQPLSIGDWVILVAGCRKRIEDCKNKFKNQRRFGGEPHIPGWDAVATGQGSPTPTAAGALPPINPPPPEVVQP